MIVSADIYSSKHALLDWLDAHGPQVPVGTKLVVASDDGRECVVIRKRDGNWRIDRPSGKDTRRFRRRIVGEADAKGGLPSELLAPAGTVSQALS